ncbi:MULTISPECIES: sensor histidine kinase [unclassified Enterococcus]|uniref:sensor histidine kinase n=1 Tax=unclassified Enterococcus TaxID=2608891 RepID=UPI000A347529|nr:MULTISPECIES: sensor histidine kinase [unclassified Enterococcus]OTO67700.1 hypothetical protein A5865_003379 [Enterococcus sp. 12E11_DIV0728]OUZ15642.1 hypothetical protein A5868_000553 [Enterococcus sp. 12F9_DIV0723]
MQLLEFLITQVTGFAGTYFLYRLIAAFIPVKDHLFFKLLLFFVAFVAVSLPIYPNDPVNISAMFVFFSIALFLSLKGLLLHKISLVLSLYPFIAALNFLLEDIGLRLWFAGGKTLALDFFLHGTALLLRGLIWYGMYQFFRYATPYAKTQISKKLWLILDLICLTPLVAMISFILFTPENTVVFYPAAFACLLTSVCSLYMTGHLAKSFRYQLENQSFQLQKDYYQELESTQKQLRKVHHDMNNHFGVMRNLLREEQAEQAENYLATLTQQHTLSNHRFCKNSIVNAVLNAKYHVIQEAGITCTMQVDIDTLITIDDIDLCSLFGNTLDNAIEAAKGAPKKELTLKARYYNGFFSYEITNTMQHKIKKSGTRFFSTKAAPQEHGIGLQSVRGIVDSYDGTLDIHYDEEHFSLVVLIGNI